MVSPQYAQGEDKTLLGRFMLLLDWGEHIVYNYVKASIFCPEKI